MASLEEVAGEGAAVAAADRREIKGAWGAAEEKDLGWERLRRPGGGVGEAVACVQEEERERRGRGIWEVSPFFSSYLA